MQNPDWTSPEKLSDDRYLSTIRLGVYVMAAKGDARLYRSGAIGIQQSENNAKKRLGQLNSGDLKVHGPWEYVFLAQLPRDIGTDLTQAEKALQKALRAQFKTEKRDLFQADEVQTVQHVARQAVQDFLATLSSEGTADLKRSLEQYICAVEAGAPRHSDFRYEVLHALRMCLDGPLAVRLLDALK